jgi:hypothetical protein
MLQQKRKTTTTTTRKACTCTGTELEALDARIQNRTLPLVLEGKWRQDEPFSLMFTSAHNIKVRTSTFISMSKLLP